MVGDAGFAEGAQAYVGDELVVSTPHVGLVRRELRSDELERGDPEVSDLLGLARLRVRARTAGPRLVDAVRQQGSTEIPPVEPLDQVLWGLRRVIGHQYAGWAPPMGKNRYLGRVHGTGEISHGGGGDPQPTEPPELQLRAGGPGRGVRVGVLDTRFHPQPWLAGAWQARFSDLLGPGPHAYTDGHATFVTGLILSQAPGATVEVRGVLDEDGQAESWHVAEEIVRLGASGVDVLNLSLVCYTGDGEEPLLIGTAIDRLPPELVVVAAAGNHGQAGNRRHGGQHGVKPAWPAALDDVIAVGAVDAKGRLADFSPAAPWVDVLAPGVRLRSTYLRQAGKPGGRSQRNFGDWARWSGTSFAAALVTGAVAAGTVPGGIPARAAVLDIFAALARPGTSKERATLAPVLQLPTW